MDDIGPDPDPAEEAQWKQMIRLLVTGSNDCMQWYAYSDSSARNRTTHEI